MREAKLEIIKQNQSTNLKHIDYEKTLHRPFDHFIGVAALRG